MLQSREAGQDTRIRVNLERMKLALSSLSFITSFEILRWIETENMTRRSLPARLTRLVSASPISRDSEVSPGAGAIRRPVLRLLVPGPVAGAELRPGLSLTRGVDVLDRNPNTGPVSHVPGAYPIHRARIPYTGPASRYTQVSCAIQTGSSRASHASSFSRPRCP
jgi:hypothetical protein